MNWQKWIARETLWPSYACKLHAVFWHTSALIEYYSTYMLQYMNVLLTLKHFIYFCHL